MKGAGSWSQHVENQDEGHTALSPFSEKRTWPE